MASILHFYGFHILQMSPTGMDRVRHFDVLCRYQGMRPTVENFRAFYQLIRNIGFYSFGNCGAAKKILSSPPKSFHDWKMKFFFIREEVMPIAMIFRASNKIDKEELPIPKGDDWYMRLLATPSRTFGEQVLVSAAMCDKWPERSEDVPVLMFNGEAMSSAQLYQAAFPTFGGSMGVRPLEADETYWYEQIKGNFLYPPAGAFANPPTVTDGAQLPKPRPLRGVTSAEKEILFRSSEESVGSSQEEPKKAPSKKKPSKKIVILDTGATSKKAGGSRATVAAQDKGTLRLQHSNLEDYVVASDSLEGLSRIGEKKKGNATASKSSGSAGSRAPESGTTPSSIPVEEEEEHEEEGPKLVTRKRTREEGAAGANLAQKATVVREPEPEKPKEPAPKKTKFIIIPPKPNKKEVEKTIEEPTGDVIPEKEKVKETETAPTIKQDKAQGPEVVHITGLDQPFKREDPEVVKPTVATQHDAPTKTVQVTSVAGGSAATVPEQTAHKDTSVAAAGAGA
ncbi:hypothetical protein Hanom_Chr06g00520771 [Helianthus anomalus]